MNRASPPKILIIDDEAIIRQSFSDYLEDLGYEIFIAENGRLGLEILNDVHLDLIITDLRMPEMSGLEVIKQAQIKDPNLPVVVISGAEGVRDAVEALRLGAWDYILKPISEMFILENLVKRALSKKQLLQVNRDHQENLASKVHEQTLELRDSNERTAEILNAIQSGVMVINAETHEIIEVNPAAAKMIEAKEEEIIGRICYDFICPAEEGECPVSDKEESRDNAECIMLTKSGKEKKILKNVVKIELDGQDCLLESFIDITKHTQAEYLLRESEIYYQAIIDVQADLLYRYSFEGDVTFSNKSFCRFFGVDASEAIGQKRFNFILPEYHEAVREVTACLNAEEPVLIHENQNINSKGKAYWFHWTNQAILDDAGEIIEYQSVGRDITKRKRGENLQNLLYRISQAANRAHTPDDLYPVIHKIIQKIMPAENFYIALYQPESDSIETVYFVDEKDEKAPVRLLAQGLTAYVLRTEIPLLCPTEKFNELLSKGEIIEAGAPSSVWLGVPLITKGETIGVMATQHYQDENAYGEEEKTMLEIISSSVSSAITHQLAQEETISLNLALEERVAIRTNELNERISMVEKLNSGMSNLLEDLNTTNAIAEENAEELKQANAELESFSYSVSHDLRAPLRHIESFTKLLSNHLSEDLDNKSERYIKNIVASTERMRNLIEDLLTLSRTSRADLHIKPLDMNGIVESVYANLLGEVSERDIVWKVEQLPLVQADIGLIKILWENLIGNAIKYTKRCKKATIEIGVLPSAKNPVFFIQDNGVGFPSEYKEQLFNVFERLHKSDDFEGSGIGLATVKRIVERHKGEVWGKGEVDKGATFYFSLEGNAS
ncbi:MAG: response regulator [Anaerolineae bacterium]|jgi:PAS domain S-box-containing protein|nr:response regulator [Anaerolineae bacterium]MBT7075517.1 response regulator [Anaerolineae bacterium]MBT7783087.1 response regulator [Anaerolineae bacterium]